jgi:hypothetical protein
LTTSGKISLDAAGTLPYGAGVAHDKHEQSSQFIEVTMKSKSFRTSVYSLAILFLATSCGTKAGTSSKPPRKPKAQEAWNSANDPLNLSYQYSRKFSALPLQGQTATQPWTDWYWPSRSGGVGFRWITGETPFVYASPSLSQLKQMSYNELASLSPAEKFDLFRGDLSYSTVRSERQRTSPYEPEWAGICHGWAPAAFLYNEPQPVVLQAPNGLKIPFGSSDIKAMLSYYLAQVANGPVRFLGTRCDIDLATAPYGALSPECRDTNAGAFHVVLANQIGLMRKSFIADITRDAEVWNQPISGFRSRVIGERQGASPGAAPGTVREVTLETSMAYVSEITPVWELVGARNDVLDSAAYRYRLELNSAGDIVGGEWESEAQPDFLWNMEAVQFSGAYAALGDIYKAATRGSATPTTPDEPTNPTTPDEPTNPTTPDEPTNPTTPDQPTNPTTPDQPTNPTTPDQPTNPTTPNQPTNPTTPTGPVPPQGPQGPQGPQAPTPGIGGLPIYPVKY